MKTSLWLQTRVLKTRAVMAVIKSRSMTSRHVSCNPNQQAAVRSLCVDVQRQLFMSNANMLYKFAHHLIEMRTEH